MDRSQEYGRISEVVAKYVRGMCGANADLLREAMHEKACCIGHFDGGLEWDHREAFIAGTLKAVETPDPDPWFQINSMTIIGDMATVQVEDIWLGMHFDDTLTLLLHEGQWVIVSKLFYLRPAD
ncbi:nuclear transport factor 2 family protein [Aestuariivita boseongensis]|uniref:nuclear transport factor 2 family protein n=1 Tax=Aestuariivita boseongensis TaxID=1470562 RepID=UPI000681A485|nr:nuclear transport factor 2 family protein [Aestuariivita boseongensis]